MVETSQFFQSLYSFSKITLNCIISELLFITVGPQIHVIVQFNSSLLLPCAQFCIISGQRKAFLRFYISIDVTHIATFKHTHYTVHVRQCIISSVLLFHFTEFFVQQFPVLVLLIFRITITTCHLSGQICF
jgi:hypothetical protein